jgi:hypothetical protein
MTDPVEVIARAIEPDVWEEWSAVRRIRAMEKARIALAALEGEGMAVVPVEPSLPMLLAGDSALCSALECTCQEGAIYRAMVGRRPR